MLRQAEELHGSKADRDATRPEYVNKWGYVFKWTPEHIPAAEIAAQKKQYDELGSAALERLLEIGNAQTASAGEKGAAAPRRPDLYATLKEHHGDDAVLRRFWEQTHAVPDWVDWEQLRRGQRVFYRYSMLMIVGLAFQGFLGETSVSPHAPSVRPSIPWPRSPRSRAASRRPASPRCWPAPAASTRACCAAASSRPSSGCCR